MLGKQTDIHLLTKSNHFEPSRKLIFRRCFPNFAKNLNVRMHLSYVVSIDRKCYVSHLVLDFHYHAVNSEPMPDLTLVQQQLVNSSEIDDNEINQN